MRNHSSTAALVLAISTAVSTVVPAVAQMAPSDKPTQIPPADGPDRVAQVTPPESAAKEESNWLKDNWLTDHGISINAFYFVTFGKNLRGGADTADEIFDNLFDVTLTLDSEKLAGFKGGTFVTSFEHNGGDRFYEHVGDFAGSSDISGPRRDQINEFYYEQKLLDDKLRIKLGKMDVNYEFATSEPAYEFINSSFYWSPTLVGMPTFPDPSFGVMVGYEPTDDSYMMLGIYDGAAQEGVRTGNRGPASLLGSPGDLFYVIEAGYKPALVNGLQGRIALGAFHHDGTWGRFDGSEADGTSGAYVVID